jgi:hypothetical protein
MNNLSLLFLGGDFLAALGGIYVLKEFWPTWDQMAVEIGVAVGSGFLVNALFMVGSTPSIMLLHALAGGLVGWYFNGNFIDLVMPAKQ